MLASLLHLVVASLVTRRDAFSARSDIDFAGALDQACDLKICYNSELQCHPHGIISEFSHSDSGFQGTRYSMQVRPTLSFVIIQDSLRYPT